MLEFRLHYRRSRKGPSLRLGWLARFAFLTLAVVQTSLMMLVRQYPPVLLVLVFLCLLGMSYRESWHVDAQRDHFVRSTGFLFWKRELHYEHSHVIALHLELSKGKHIISLNKDDHGNPVLPAPHELERGIKTLLQPYKLSLYLIHASKGKILMERHLLQKNDQLVRAALAFADFVQVRID